MFHGEGGPLLPRRPVMAVRRTLGAKSHHAVRPRATSEPDRPMERGRRQAPSFIRGSEPSPALPLLCLSLWVPRSSSSAYGGVHGAYKLTPSRITVCRCPNPWAARAHGIRRDPARCGVRWRRGSCEPRPTSQSMNASYAEGGTISYTRVPLHSGISTRERAPARVTDQLSRGPAVSARGQPIWAVWRISTVGRNQVRSPGEVL
jgi:hypothetical protein